MCLAAYMRSSAAGAESKGSTVSMIGWMRWRSGDRHQPRIFTRHVSDTSATTATDRLFVRYNHFVRDGDIPRRNSFRVVT